MTQVESECLSIGYPPHAGFRGAVYFDPQGHNTRFGAFFFAQVRDLGLVWPKKTIWCP
jgi:hypothetical protein